MSNKAAAGDARSQNLDVVFFGDSITEGWTGKQYGNDRPGLEDVLEVFDSYFYTDRGGEVEGLALGIAGDTVSPAREN